MSPCDTSSKEGDKPELKPVQSTTKETSTYGDPDPRLLSQSYTAKKPFKRSSSKEGEDTDTTRSGLAEIQTASNSDLESLVEEEGGNHQGPHRQTSHSAHTGLFCRYASTPLDHCATGGLSGVCGFYNPAPHCAMDHLRHTLRCVAPTFSLSFGLGQKENHTALFFSQLPPCLLADALTCHWSFFGTWS